MAYEYQMKYVAVSKKGWKELGEALAELPGDDWELFMAVPVTVFTAYWFGLSGSRTSAIIHYFRREKN